MEQHCVGVFVGSMQEHSATLTRLKKGCKIRTRVFQEFPLVYGVLLKYSMSTDLALRCANFGVDCDCRKT